MARSEALTSEYRPPPSGYDECEEDEQVTQGTRPPVRVLGFYLLLVLGPQRQATTSSTLFLSQLQAIERPVPSVVQQFEEPSPTLFAR